MVAMPSILSVYYRTIRSGLARERGEVEGERGGEREGSNYKWVRCLHSILSDQIRPSKMGEGEVEVEEERGEGGERGA